MILKDRSRSDTENVCKIHADMLYRVCLSYLSNGADAEDAVQDTFLKYLTKSPQFYSSEHEKAWLLRVAINRCKDILKKKSYSTELPLDEALNVPAKEENSEINILELLKKLPDKYRSVVVVHCLEGFSLTETCSIMGITLSAGKMRLKRAREMLKKIREEESDVY